MITGTFITSHVGLNKNQITEAAAEDHSQKDKYTTVEKIVQRRNDVCHYHIENFAKQLAAFKEYDDRIEQGSKPEAPSYHIERFENQIAAFETYDALVEKGLI